MKHTHYTLPVHHFIYALTLEDSGERWFYVSKTRSGRLSAVYSKHICGNIAATAGVFSKEARPELYLLQEGEMTGAEAYKHVVAWTSYFMENHYLPLNHEGTMYHADHMLPETLEIYQSISTEPLEAILSRTHLERPSSVDRKKPPSKPEKALLAEKTQINIRTNQYDKTRFQEFCHKTNLHQNEAFTLLLDQIQSDTVSSINRILSPYQKSLTLLEQKNKKLRDKIANGCSEKMTPAAKWAVNYVPFLLDGVQHYLSKLDCFAEKQQKQLPSYAYKKFMKQLPPNLVYAYPEEEGYLLLTLEAILWGSPLHKACFYLGRDQNGTPCKLRYYAKSWFCGTSPRDNAYGYAGAVWLIGCKRAKDGAMDMVFALPIPEHTPDPSAPKTTAKQKKPKPSLDDTIRAANARRR